MSTGYASQLTKKSFLAGALISVGALFSLAAREYGPVVQGLCFGVGLTGVMWTQSSLFTGRVLDSGAVMRAEPGHERATALDRLVGELTVAWALNLLGAVVVALHARAMHFDASAVATAKAAMPWRELVIRAIFCNVMVCLAVFANRRANGSPLAAPVICALPVACFVACGFEHCVADMLYMPLGFMQGAVTPMDCVRVIGLATVGNVMGGVAFAWLAEAR